LARRGQLADEQLLALRSALLPGAQAENAFREWRGLVDFDTTDGPTYRLLPLIYRNLEARLGADPVVGRMRGIYRRTWVLNAIQLEEGERAIAALSDSEIPTMVLKGAAMVARWTGDSGVRMMADFDVLVPRERALEALSKLLEDGWEPVVGRAGSLTEADLDEEHAILLRSDRRGELDLHWRGRAVMPLTAASGVERSRCASVRPPPRCRRPKTTSITRALTPRRGRRAAEWTGSPTPP
jgi:Uncharacterised nucleotidyltransferase